MFHIASQNGTALGRRAWCGTGSSTRSPNEARLFPIGQKRMPDNRTDSVYPFPRRSTIPLLCSRHDCGPRFFPSRGFKLRAIFISYRRHDSEGEAGRLFDDLVGQFGEASVFMDVAAIDVGRDFRRAIDESIGTCGVLLAIIGPGWLEQRNEKGERRLDDPADFVRLETASALKRDIPVIPVLVRGAKMPRSEQLPDDLKDLAYRNCVELTHVRWKSDVKILTGGLRTTLGVDVGAVSDPASTTIRNNSGTTAVPDACAAALDGDAVSRVTKDLARYIGPIAEIVVKRAAKKCATIGDLRRVVAQEIEGHAERSKFLEACG